MQTHSDSPRLEALSRQEFWRQHLDRCGQSSLSKIAYCRENDLTYHQMMYWQKRLKPSDSTVQVNQKQPTPGFIPIVVDAQDRTATSLSITLPNGLIISGITEATLSWIKPLLSQL